MMRVVLLGDSILDNGRYVAPGQAVTDQLGRVLAGRGTAVNLAVDGSLASDVTAQLARVPADATHLVISAGGNNALQESQAVRDPSPRTLGEALGVVHELGRAFQAEYRAMLQAVVALGLPVAVCTVYEAVPGLQLPERVGLGAFNEVILREAIVARVPVLDLRFVCVEAADYAESSPIEPSAAGGAKIAWGVGELLRQHDFSRPACAIYC